jgi:hypothetical protein
MLIKNYKSDLTLVVLQLWDFFKKVWRHLSTPQTYTHLSASNLYLIIKRQNFTHFFRPSIFFVHVLLTTGSREFLPSILDCVWSIFNQRVKLIRKKKSIPNMITIYSKFIFFLFLFLRLFGLFCFFRLSPISYLSDPFFIFVFVSLLFLISSFCFSSPFFFFPFLDYQVRFMPFPLLFCISFFFPILSFFYKYKNK